MEPHAVVVSLYVGEEVCGGGGAGGVAAGLLGEGYSFTFVGGHPGLHRGVVVGVAGTAHARLDAGGGEQGAVFGTGILDAAIAMMEQAARRVAMAQGHAQRGQRGVGGA